MAQANGSLMWRAVTAFAAAHEDVANAALALLYGGREGDRPAAEAAALVEAQAQEQEHGRPAGEGDEDDTAQAQRATAEQQPSSK